MDDVPYPMRYVLESVAERLPVYPRSRTATTEARYEEELKWRNVKLRLEYLATVLPPAQMREEVDEGLSILRQASGVLDAPIETEAVD